MQHGPAGRGKCMKREGGGSQILTTVACNFKQVPQGTSQFNNTPQATGEVSHPATAASGSCSQLQPAAHATRMGGCLRRIPTAILAAARNNDDQLLRGRDDPRVRQDLPRREALFAVHPQ